MRRLPALLAAAVLCLGASRASAALQGPRTAHTSTYLPTGNVLNVGGIDNTGIFLNDGEVVHTSKDRSYTAVGNTLAIARSSHTATLMGNGCVLIAGGINGGGAVATAQIYDPILNQFGASIGMTGRYNHTATLLNDGRVLLCAGQATGGGVLASCDIFTPNGVMGGVCGGSMSLAPVSLLHLRTMHTASLLQDGTVWFAGGWDGTILTPTSERYTPSFPGAGSFSSASPMIQARSNHTATMMGDGRIFVAGGYDGIDLLANRGILDTTEIFDPIANDTIPGPTLEARRQMHTSVLSADGSVALFGGLGNITTTYIGAPTLAFNGPPGTVGTESQISVNAGAITSGALTPNMTLDFNLAVGVVGTISNGQAQLAAPSAKFAWGTATLSDAADAPNLFEPLGGAQAICNNAVPPLCGVVGIPALYMPNIGGTATFNAFSPAVAATAGGGSLTMLLASPTALTAASDITFSPTFTVAQGLVGATLSGTIGPLNGTLTSTSYTIALAAGTLTFAGALVDINSQIDLPGQSVTGLLGAITYNPISGISNSAVSVTAGNLFFTPTPLDGLTNFNGVLTAGSNATFSTTLDLPPDLANANIVNGVFTIQSGQITENGGTPAGNRGYSVALTGGSYNFSGTPDGAGHLTVTNVNATNLAGTIQWSTNTVNSGDNMQGPQAQITLTGGVTYQATHLDPAGAAVSVTGPLTVASADNINISGVTMTVNASTVVVNSMLFGQEEIYNPTTNSVAFDPDGPSPSIETFGQSAVLLPNSDIYIAGGSDCTTAACLPFASRPTGVPFSRDVTYLNEPKTFTTIGALNTPRALHTATLLPDGTIMVAGGTTGLNLLNSAEILNTNTGLFSLATGSMTNVRDLHTATLLDNGRVLIAGGVSTNALSTGAISAADIYYPDTQLFLPTTPMITARSNHTATLMPDGSVIVVGGFGTGDVITGTAEKYDPEHMTWTALAPLPTLAACGGIPCVTTLHTATLLQDGRLMIAGGISPAGVLPLVYAYSPGSNTWAQLASMPVPLRSHTATLLPDGRVLVAGGDNGNGETNSSYFYCPVNTTPNCPAIGWTAAPTTSPLSAPRFGHTATLLPDGAVMISGGSTKSGSIPTAIELYHVNASSWTPGNQFFQNPFTRAFHTMTLGADGNVYAIGGSNGVIGGVGTALWTNAEKGYFSSIPDQVSKNAPPSLRQSTFTITSVTPLSNTTSEIFNVVGTKFTGGTEAGGGGSASANSSFNSPHLLLQKTDGASSDFILDLTQGLFSAASPQIMNTSLSATLPAAAASLPAGWYNARVGVNGVYSNGTFLQVGPAKPGAVTGLTGTAQGFSSVTWTWNALAGCTDGYNVYIASDNVFIATVAVSATPTFAETGLPPNSVAQVKVACYSLSGDGAAEFSPATAVTPITVVNSIQCEANGYGGNNSGDTPTSIQWNWNNVVTASSYRVFNATSGALIATVVPPQFEDTGLAINSARELTVGAVTGGVLGPLAPLTTCYTLAAVPLPPTLLSGIPLMTSTETTSVSINWIANGNPVGTNYVTTFSAAVGTAVYVSTGSTAGLTQYFGGLTPSDYYSAAIVAQNIVGTPTVPLIAGTTYTLPNPAATLAIQGTTPISITGSWSTNSNSTMTYYQLTYSTDNFVTVVSTAIPFSSHYGGSTFTITGLITGFLYDIRLQAENPFGQTSITISTDATTFNGGAPAGSLEGVLTALGLSEISGDLDITGSITRTIDMRASGGTFPSDTTVIISSFSLSDPGHAAFACTGAVLGSPSGAGIALSIADNPALQPTHPVFLTASYTAAEAASFSPTPTSQLAVERYDPGSGTCVPLPTTFDPVGQTFLVQLNHFSLYELVAVPLATTVGTARIFPNPYRAATDSYITIDQVPPSSRVRVFTLRGERILDTTADGTGTVTWTANNSAGRSMASGEYLVVIEANGGKNILKLVVIR